MKQDGRRQLVPRLFVELFQTEKSACEHPRIEAERLGETPPAYAMLAVSAHAERTLAEIRRVAEAEALVSTSVGTFLGGTFSAFRDWFIDRALDREKSYRATLIGLRHGIDLVRLLHSASRSERRSELVEFCRAWLSQRPPLVEAAARQLDWFGAHAPIALESSRTRLERHLSLFAPSAPGSRGPSRASRPVGPRLARPLVAPPRRR
jgi:hypothetical protein